MTARAADVSFSATRHALGLALGDELVQVLGRERPHRAVRVGHSLPRTRDLLGPGR
jgi:hypothetical protein